MVPHLRLESAVEGSGSAEYSAPSFADLTCHQLEELAKERGNHGDIKGAVTALQAGQTLLVRQDPSVAAQWREKSDVEGRAATRTYASSASLAVTLFRW